MNKPNAILSSHMLMHTGILMTVLLLCCAACRSGNNITQQQKFEKAGWSATDGVEYPARPAMLDDLLRNQKLHGLSRTQLIDLLGPPARTDRSYLFYPISQKRFGTWPIHTKTLVIKLGKDSLVEWRKVHE